MTEFQSRLHDLDSCIENAKKERLNLMIENYREPLNASLLNTLFLNEKLCIASRDLLSTLDDIQTSLKSINRLLDDDSLKLQGIAFKDNNSIIENSIDQQKVVLNKYISNLQLILSVQRREDDVDA
ncbi:hypothetical protein DWY01_05345 [Eubacterium sp. AF22-8LB]|uniref:hypothetical protein n=1 Tax=Eubacterium sp. AF22-8LB TaxID=2292232 RepID=UPI000E466975|nr:hypothetical protein [Eubacterium sp. AF22-8LB]RGS30878.1 hypothetical protein DWY01_05345 [Eubacterium sp. AF22-8LB]